MPDHLRYLLLVLVVLLVGAGACAIPADQQPDTVALDTEFSELLEPAPPTDSTTTTSQPATRNVPLYFVVDDTLALALTPMSVGRADDLTAVLNELAGGTRLENHRNAIPTGVQIASTSVDTDRRIARIQLADNALFTAAEGNERLRAIAQIVFTATGNRFGVDAVQFEVDGNIRTVPTGGGSDKTEPVGRCDYRTVAADSDVRDCPSPSTTTTSSPQTEAPSSTD